VRQLADITLTPNQLQVLEELRRRLRAEFDIEAMILYGSAARGDADEESDQDVLIVTAHPISRPERDKITEAVFELNLRYDTNISTIVVDRERWETGAAVCLLRDEVLQDGIML
jgi:predicted nucleotidyltransferase